MLSKWRKLGEEGGTNGEGRKENEDLRIVTKEIIESELHNIFHSAEHAFIQGKMDTALQLYDQILHHNLLQVINYYILINM